MHLFCVHVHRNVSLSSHPVSTATAAVVSDTSDTARYLHCQQQRRHGRPTERLQDRGTICKTLRCNKTRPQWFMRAFDHTLPHVLYSWQQHNMGLHVPRCVIFSIVCASLHDFQGENPHSELIYHLRGKPGPNGYGSSTTAEQVATSWDGEGKVSCADSTFPLFGQKKAFLRFLTFSCRKGRGSPHMTFNTALTACC